jgi:hypothetical protein
MRLGPLASPRFWTKMAKMSPFGDILENPWSKPTYPASFRGSENPRRARRHAYVTNNMSQPQPNPPPSCRKRDLACDRRGK